MWTLCSNLQSSSRIGSKAKIFQFSLGLWRFPIPSPNAKCPINSPTFTSTHNSPFSSQQLVSTILTLILTQCNLRTCIGLPQLNSQHCILPVFLSALHESRTAKENVFQCRKCARNGQASIWFWALSCGYQVNWGKCAQSHPIRHAQFWTLTIKA